MHKAVPFANALIVKSYSVIELAALVSVVLINPIRNNGHYAKFTALQRAGLGKRVLQ